MARIITSNRSPDIDGTACIFAYSEFLSKKGIENKIHFSQRPDALSNFALSFLKVRVRRAPISQKDEISLVDASQLAGLPKEILPGRVSEIIDHRISRDLSSFPNAKIQTELVGAAATLIAEKFFQEDIPVSRESAVLLYSAIVVNTVNFRAKVTTGRDVAMSRRLLKLARLPKNYLKLLFHASEKFPTSLKKTLDEEFACQEFSCGKVGIVQLETADGEKFVRKNRSLLSRELPKLFARKGVSIGFLSCLDLENGRNVFLAKTPLSKKFIAETIGKTRFSGEIGTRTPPIMRKEIWRLLLAKS